MVILVTGAAGFIGSRLCESLTKDGHTVIAVDKLEHFADRKSTLPTGAWKAAWGRDSETLWRHDGGADSLLEKQISAILHLGACADTSQMDLEYLNKWNVEYSKKIYQLAVEHEIPFVYASSAATYGAGESGYDDDESQFHRLHPLNPYGASKLSFDRWVLEQEKQGNTPPAWSGFKFFNVYGFGEFHKGRMASVVLHGFRQLQERGKILLFQSHKAGIEDGEQKRDFVQVEDVIRVIKFALWNPIPRGIFNLGTGQARSFLDLAKATIATYGESGRDFKIDFIPTPENLRAQYQYFTQAQMNKLRVVGYSHPFLSLEDGVQLYVKALISREKSSTPIGN